MKTLFTILLLVCSLMASADKWYIATTGSNTHGKGTLTDPWLTLKHACDTVTGANFVGDTVMVGVGTFSESAQVDLNVGVSIMGAGETSIITTSAALNPVIELYSTAEGTDGNQSISYLKLDGNNLAGTRAVFVYLRKNVKIHHVTIEDFSAKGVDFDGSLGATPTIYATGNEIHDCIFTNTCGRGGVICFTGQSGISIHDNIITAYQRALGHDPTPISMTGGGSKGMLFYNNTINMDRYMFDTNGTTLLWGIAMESWDCDGGYQVYDNVFNGATCMIDVGGTYNVKGAFDYSWDIHDNTFQWSAQGPTEITGPFSGITMEGGVADIRIRDNYFKNLPIGINSSIIQASRIHENFYIYSNIFENMGWGNDVWGFGMWIGQGTADAITRNVFILNNVIDSGTGAEGSLSAGILLNSSNSVTNVTIENNIIQNVTGYGCIAFYNWSAGETIADIYVHNNLYYNNVSSNDYYYNANATVTNLVDSGNIEDDPDFVAPASDFHLQVTSPARDAGIDVSSITGGLDYDGLPLYGTAYDIGAFEYTVGVLRLLLLNNKLTIISGKVTTIQ